MVEHREPDGAYSVLRESNMGPFGRSRADDEALKQSVLDHPYSDLCA